MRGTLTVMTALKLVEAATVQTPQWKVETKLVVFIFSGNPFDCREN
jgi:hypothetical protein